MRLTADAKVRVQHDSIIVLVIFVTNSHKSVAKMEGPGVLSSATPIFRLDNTQARVRDTSPEPVPKE